MTATADTSQLAVVERLRRQIAYYERMLQEQSRRSLSYQTISTELRRRLAQHRRGLDLLLEISRRSERCATLEQLLETATHLINPVLIMERSLVLVVDSEQARMHPLYWLGFSAAEAARLPSCSVDLPADFCWKGDSDLLQNSGAARSSLGDSLRTTIGLPFLVGTPVMLQDTPLAYIVAGRAQESAQRNSPALDEGDLDTFRALATLLSTLVHNLQLVDLRRADQLRVDFFAKMSHEFRTPITLTLGPLETVLSGEHGSLSPNGNQLLSMAVRNQRRLLHLINQILDRSRMDAGEFPLDFRETRVLDEIVTGCANDFRPLASQRRLQIVRRSSPAVARVSVEIDIDAIERCLLNLLSNACKFTPSGQIEVETRLVPDYVEIIVRDTGVGIAEEQLGQIFEPFRQSDSGRSSSASGSGLGLSLVRDLMRLHGGEALAESQPGLGSAFTLRIPVKSTGLGQAPPGPDGGEDEQARGGAGRAERLGLLLSAGASSATYPELPTTVRPSGESVAVAGSRSRLLIVEDNDELARLLTAYLSASYEVLWAVDGYTGIKMAEEHRPDLLLTDYMMPGMDGLELIRHLRGAGSSLPIIMLTARTDALTRATARESGADVYLAKPFNREELLAAVARLLRQREIQENDLLRAQVDSLQLVSAGIGHELNNALSYFKNSLFVIQEQSRKLAAVASRSEQADEACRRMERMYETADRAVIKVARMIDQLRKYSGEGSAERETHVLVDQSVTDVLACTTDPEGEVVVQTDLRAPGVCIRCVSAEFHHALANICQNAFDAAVSQVWVASEVCGEHVVVTIADDGPGISEEAAERAFSAFYSTKDPSGRMGLGLTISHRAVRRLGGTIAAANRPVGGAVFSLKLPIAKDVD